MRRNVRAMTHVGIDGDSVRSAHSWRSGGCEFPRRPVTISQCPPPHSRRHTDFLSDIAPRKTEAVA